MRQILLLILLSANPAFADFSAITWNIKHLGRTSLDLEKASSVVAGYDLILLQEVNTSESGAKALRELAGKLGYCYGLSVVPTGSRERYAFLWKESAIAYVKTSGEVIATCPAFAVTFKVADIAEKDIVRESAYGLFLDRETKKKFYAFNAF